MTSSILALTVFSLLFGAQFLRTMLPSIDWYLQEVLGFTVWQAVLVWCGPFVLAFVAPVLVWWLKPRGAFWAAGVGLILCRLFLEQAWTPQVINIAAALAGMACCLCLLLLLHGRALAEGPDGLWAFLAGILLSLAVDTAVRGLTGTVDLTWIRGPWARLAALALAAVFAYALWQGLREQVRLAAPSFFASLPLTGLGLFLFVEWITIQNQGWMETFTGWSPGAALGWIMLANLAALLAAAAALTNPGLRSRGWWLVIPGAALTLAMVFSTVPGWTFAVVALVGLVSAGVLLAVIVGAGEPSSARVGRVPVSVTLWLGILVFATLVVVYTIAFVVRLPFQPSVLAPAAAVGLTACALVAARMGPGEQRDRGPARASGWSAARLGALLLLAPAAVLVSEAWPAPTNTQSQGYPVRVMTYNIRDAYGMNGRQDLEAIAQQAEGAGAGVVALQEIGRGSLLDNGVDLVSVLSRRLNMPYTLFDAAIDPLFGDAILSRYPFLSSGQGNLPALYALTGSRYAWVQLDLGSGAKLLVITSHLYSPPGPKGSLVRVAQAQGLLMAWAGRPQAVIVGDMNASLGSPEMQTLLDSGLSDSWAEAGHGQRPAIDWIFHTPDLVARDVATIDSQASDHLAVVATIAPSR